MQVFTANETETQNVWFDNLKVDFTPQLIVQENHYYPFGLELAGLNKLNKPEHKFKYNGVENEQVFGLNWNETYYRTYDLQLGRWHQIDPKNSERESAYVGMGNNPVFYLDPVGDTVRYDNIASETKAARASLVNTRFGRALRAWNTNPNISVTFSFEGETISEETRQQNRIPAGVGAFVRRDGDNQYTIIFTSDDSEKGTFGQSPSHRIIEEAFHLDDALGGEQFGGTNQNAFSFNEETGVLQNNDSYRTEADAWIFVADNTSDIPEKSTVTHQGNELIVQNPLMKQIQNTRTFSIRKRRMAVRQKLFGVFWINTLPKNNNGGNIEKRLPVRGPYNNN